MLGREQDVREIADYDVYHQWIEEETQHVVRQAEAFVNRMREYVRKEGIRLEEDEEYA